jgi:hypothetical protein
MNDDPWITIRTEIEPERFHALGAMLLRWNSCETGLFFLLLAITGWSPAAAKALVHAMSEAALSSRIRDLLAVHPLKPREMHEAVLYALDLFNINRMNRNVYAHFLPTGGKNGMEFWRTEGASFERRPIPNALEDIRRTVEEMEACASFIGAVGNRLVALRRGSQPEPLPTKPSMPLKLWPPPEK